MNLKTLFARLSIAVVVMALLAGVVSWYSLNGVNAGAESLSKARSVSEHALLVRLSVTQIQQFLTDASLTGDADAIQSAKKNLENGQTQLQEMAALMPDHQAEFQKMSADLLAFYQQGLLMQQAYQTKGKAAGDEVMKAPHGFDETAELLAKQTETMDKWSDENYDKAKHSLAEGLFLQRLLVSLALLVLSAAFLWTLAWIYKYLLRILGGEPGEAFAEVRALAEGDFSTHATQGRASAGLLAALYQVRDTLQQFQKAQVQMADEHTAGLIDRRIPAHEFKGGYRQLCEQVNDLVAAHIAVKMRVVELVQRYGAGDFSQLMEDLPGQKAKITQAINMVRQQLSEVASMAVENQRIRIALDNVSSNVMIADNDRKIIYMNRSVQDMLQSNESEIRKVLPNFTASKLLGSNMDVFHKNPSHQAHLLAGLRNNYKAQITVGTRHFTLSANPVVDSQGQRMGSVVEWKDRTDEVLSEQEINGLVSAAARGDFSQRAKLEGKTGFFLQVSEGINRLMGTCEVGLNEVVTVLSAVAKGDLTQKIKGDYEGTFDALKQGSNTTVDNLLGIVQQIREATDTITTAAREIASGNQNLSGRTEQQAASLEETASSMEELTSTVRQNADNARQANRRQRLRHCRQRRCRGGPSRHHHGRHSRQRQENCRHHRRH